MWLRIQAGTVRRGSPFYMTEQWECVDLCLRMGKELVRSLWVRIRGQTNGNDIVVEKGKPEPIWS